MRCATKSKGEWSFISWKQRAPDKYRYIEEYLDQTWIREELGIDPLFGNFSAVSMDVLQSLWRNGDNLHQTELYVAQLLERGIRVLIYAGTLDWIANWVSCERWMLEMEWSGQDKFRSAKLREWLVDGQIVGRRRSSGNLTFATIHSAGHMVCISPIPTPHYWVNFTRCPSIGQRWH